MEITPLFIALASFILGFIVGVVTSELLSSGSRDQYQRKLAGFIALIWALSLAAGIAIPDYNTPMLVHLIMGGATGYIFGIDNPVHSLGGS